MSENGESNGKCAGKSGPGAGRIRRFEVRLTEEEWQILEDLSKDTWISKSDLIRIALKNLSKTVKKWNIS